MKTITVRKIPDEIYAKLVEWGKKSHRSLQEQVRYILEREVNLVQPSSLERPKIWRRKLRGRNFGDIIENIRKDRAR